MTSMTRRSQMKPCMVKAAQRPSSKRITSAIAIVYGMPNLLLSYRETRGEAPTDGAPLCSATGDRMLKSWRESDSASRCLDIRVGAKGMRRGRRGNRSCFSWKVRYYLISTDSYPRFQVAAPSRRQAPFRPRAEHELILPPCRPLNNASSHKTRRLALSTKLFTFGLCPIYSFISSLMPLYTSIPSSKNNRFRNQRPSYPTRPSRSRRVPRSRLPRLTARPLRHS